VSEPNRPTSELVAIAWLKGVEKLPREQIGTTLPDDVTKWPNGFVQVLTVGGTPKVYVPVRRPVVRVSCWTAGGKKPRFGEANVLAETIVSATYGPDGHGAWARQVNIATGSYAPALVLGVWPVSEPVRVPDPSGFARYDVDLELNWTPVATY